MSKRNGRARSALKKWVGLRSPSGDGARLLIIKYHRAEKHPDRGSGGRTLEEFEWQIELLGSVFNTLTVAEAAERIRNETLPERALCITFDDGYADNFVTALPILERYGLKATFFVPSGLIEQSIMWSDQIANAFAAAGEEGLPSIRNYLADAGMPVRFPELMAKLKYMSTDAQETIVRGLSAFGETESESSQLMSADQVRGLAERGMEVGGHTVNHTILTNASDELARDEITNCKTQLEAIIGQPVRSFAFPNGRRDQDYSERDVAIVREAGFAAAVNTEFGLARGGDQVYELPRIPQYFITPLRLFRVYA